MQTMAHSNKGSSKVVKEGMLNLKNLKYEALKYKIDSS